MRINAFEPGAFETLGALIMQAIEQYPERTAMVDADGASTSYRALGDRIGQLIGTFNDLGMQRGDVVAQLCGNRTEMFCVMAAAYVGGFCSVTLHAMAGADDHAAVLEDCNAKLFIYEHYFAQRAGELKSRSQQPVKWRSHDSTDADPCIWLDRSGKDAAAPKAVGGREDIVRLAYTGGTTGRSKGVMLSNRAMLSNVRLWLSGLAWRDGIRTLCSAPISHGAGSLIFPTLAAGGTVFLQRGFTATSWLECVQSNAIEHTFIVPTMLYALLDHPATQEHDLSSLSALIYGASPASPARVREALDLLGPVLVQTYGQTEAPNTILILDQRAHQEASPEQLASAGEAFPGLDVLLLSEDGKPTPQGETGEICVSGPLLMSGYHGQPEQTERTLIDGYLHTGDLGRIGADGLFYIVDRKKDMIISGGFNIYPKEIEDVLSAHPDVAAVAVFGVPDPKWGEAVKAVVALKAGATTSSEQLIDFVRAKKGAIHTPKSIELVDSVPVTSLGKPDKKTLRSRYWNQQSREIA